MKMSFRPSDSERCSRKWIISIGAAREIDPEVLRDLSKVTG